MTVHGLRVHGSARKAGAWALVILIVVTLAAYATAGWLRRRHEASGDVGDPLFTQLIDPLTGVVFVAWVLVYALAIVGIRAIAVRAVRSGAPRPTRWASTVSWLYGSWWRIALVLLVIWSPALAVRWPGAINPDFALMVTEIAMTRPEFPPGAARPFDVYPIAYSLIPEGDLVWSNQHNAFLTLAYGGVAAASGMAFHSYVPGIALLSTTQALFTLFALGRALQLVGRRVEPVWVKTLALAVTAAGVMIPLWSMDLSKNPLCAAAFVWWLALLIDRVMTSDRRPRWAWEMAVATILVAVSVKFGLYVALCGAVLLLVQRLGWRTIVLAMVVPVVVLQVALRTLIGMEIVIPDDPIESRVTLLQQIALTLREDPGAVSAEDRAMLERVFDTEAMARVYTPENADPVKSSGFDDNGSYRWRTVQPEDWDGFLGVWFDIGAQRPDLYVDAFLLKTDKYLDPLSQTTPWPPMSTWDWNVSYSLDLSDVNAAGRTMLAEALTTIGGTPVRYVISPSVWTVLTILACAAAISLRHRGALTWSIPLALQIGVALLSPLNGSGRYVLGVIYATGIVFLALGAVRQTGSREPAEPRHSNPSERMAQ